MGSPLAVVIDLLLIFCLEAVWFTLLRNISILCSQLRHVHQPPCRSLLLLKNHNTCPCIILEDCEIAPKKFHYKTPPILVVVSYPSLLKWKCSYQIAMVFRLVFLLCPPFVVNVVVNRFWFISLNTACLLTLHIFFIVAWMISFTMFLFEKSFPNKLLQLFPLSKSSGPSSTLRGNCSSTVK